MNDYAVVKATDIKVREDLPRVRKEMGKIKELANSFAKFGQMQPCLVTREMHLIAGGRRLAACIEAGIDVKIVYSDTVDAITIKEMELEENIQRKALTPAEEIMAVNELHELKQKIHGAAVQGSDKKVGWRLDDTAETIGKTRASVIESISLAWINNSAVFNQCFQFSCPLSKSKITTPYVLLHRFPLHLLSPRYRNNRLPRKSQGLCS